jgi:hypothetical protein
MFKELRFSPASADDLEGFFNDFKALHNRIAL